MREGRLRRSAAEADAPLFAEDLLIEVGATQGWEVAVHDHFRAVANAIASKVRSGSAKSQSPDIAGGATLSFDISATHPQRTQVLALLADVRQRVNALWNEVEAHNLRNPLDDDTRERVFFYFGQYLENRDENQESMAPAGGDPDV